MRWMPSAGSPCMALTLSLWPHSPATLPCAPPVNPHDVLFYPSQFTASAYDPALLEGPIELPETWNDTFKGKPTAQVRGVCAWCVVHEWCGVGSRAVGLGTSLLAAPPPPHKAREIAQLLGPPGWRPPGRVKLDGEPAVRQPAGHTARHPGAHCPRSM